MSEGSEGISVPVKKPPKKGIGGELYNVCGWIPLENCVTAVPDNLIANLVPSTASPSGAKKLVEDGSSYSASGGNRVIIGAAHLDTFLLHEVIASSLSELTAKSVQTIQLPSSMQHRCIIFHSKWISVWPARWSGPGPCKLLLLCTNLATFFYNEMGTKQVFKFEYSDQASQQPADDGDLSKCARTISAIKEHILLGNDRGELHIFSVDHSPSGHHRKATSALPSISLSRTLKLCDEPVAELCARRNGLLAVGTSSGSVSIWTDIHGSQPIKSTEYVLSKPEPVTGLILWYPYAVVSFGSGVIRMYNLIQRVLSCQVYAHSRWISSMDLCRSPGLLLTVGEDDEARIWQLRRRHKGEQRSPIKLYTSIQIEDVNLIGGRFLNSRGTMLGLANLGSKDIAVYATA